MTIPYYNMINFSFKCYAINFINYLILYVCQYSGTDWIFFRRDIVKDVDVVLTHVIRLLTTAKSFLFVLYTFYNIYNFCKWISKLYTLLVCSIWLLWQWSNIDVISTHREFQKSTYQPHTQKTNFFLNRKLVLRSIVYLNNIQFAFKNSKCIYCIIIHTTICTIYLFFK